MMETMNWLLRKMHHPLINAYEGTHTQFGVNFRGFSNTLILFLDLLGPLDLRSYIDYDRGCKVMLIRNLLYVRHYYISLKPYSNPNDIYIYH